MRLYIFKNSTRLGSSYFYLFIIYYFQVQNVFILIFTLNYRVTIKSVMLEGIANMNICFACSIYDTNPVYCISVCCVTILGP